MNSMSRSARDSGKCSRLQYTNLLTALEEPSHQNVTETAATTSDKG